MKARYVDAHCHIQFDQYKEDQEAIIERMHREGVVGIVVGCDLESSQKAVILAEKYEHLYASIGLHPNQERNEKYEIEKYQTLAESSKVVAIGECGLDYFRPEKLTDEIKKAQKELFKKHITLASVVDKPLIIHARPTKGTMDAYHDLIELLREAKTSHPNLRGDIHFFVGGVAEAEAFRQLDFTVSFTAVITFAHDYDAVIRTVPLESVLSETDAPYVAPVSRRGSRNDPLAVEDVVLKIAEIRSEDPEAIRAALLENAKRLFALPIQSC
ncbi:TatD family hydrolase [Candidatus Parcubacteria bacterium]|nr:TatD family hydrolase [Candidatus Parcubacteria bacterium]